MTKRLKTVAKIAKVIGHQKEILEFQVRDISQRHTREKERLTGMEKELQANIDRFEERFYNRKFLNNDEIAFLFGMASTFFQKMELKKKEIKQIEKELEAVRVLFWEAYQKKKAVDIVHHKIAGQERKAEAVQEQKSMDYLALVNRYRQ
jgi:hypothetical protein